MTQKEFDALPLVLSPHQVRGALGVSDEGLRTLREEHPEIVVRRAGKGKYFYSKAVVARLAGLKT